MLDISTVKIPEGKKLQSIFVKSVDKRTDSETTKLLRYDENGFEKSYVHTSKQGVYQRLSTYSDRGNGVTRRDITVTDERGDVIRSYIDFKGVEKNVVEKYDYKQNSGVLFTHDHHLLSRFMINENGNRIIDTSEMCGYNDDGLCVSYTCDDSVELREYNDDGLCVKRVNIYDPDADPETINFEYNNLKQCVSETSPDTIHDIKHVYDRSNNEILEHGVDADFIPFEINKHIMRNEQGNVIYEGQTNSPLSVSEEIPSQYSTLNDFSFNDTMFDEKGRMIVNRSNNYIQFIMYDDINNTINKLTKRSDGSITREETTFTKNKMNDYIYEETRVYENNELTRIVTKTNDTRGNLVATVEEELNNHTQGVVLHEHVLFEYFN